MNSSLSNTIAFPLESSELPSPTQETLLTGIRPVLRDIAFKTALDVRRLSAQTVEQALQMGRWLWRMQRDLKRKEYSVFLSLLGWASRKARKFINLAKTFDEFEPSRLFGVELTTLLSLTLGRYSSVVAQLQEVENISQELVERLIKEKRPPRKPNGAPMPGWKQNESGGGRHYVALYDEETSLSIQRQAASEGILAQRVIAEAVALREHRQAQPSVSEIKKQYQEELKAAVDEMRNCQIEMQRQIIERDRRIAELEAQLDSKVQTQNMANNDAGSPEQESAPAPTAEPQPDSEPLHAYTEWESFATAVGFDRSRFIGVVKHWSSSERATLPPLLAAYLEAHPGAFDETLSWVSPNLLKAALSRLTFTVQSIPGCRFLSLEYLGRDCEQWIFEDRNHRLIPLSSRQDFAIECF